MKQFRNLKAVAIAIFVSTSVFQAGVLAQTKVVPPKNPYPINKDVELGREAAQQAEGRLRLLQDREVQQYVAEVGRRLAESIPAEFQHPEFRYSYKVVDAKELNAFALPGGFTYVNRGLIEAATNEGELAGVMAHEISHVALRHGTAQAAKAQKYQTGAAVVGILGSIIGGVGNVAGQVGQMGIGAYFLKFSREYEKQADILGARIMATAGYDPRDLANMFRTIERSGGGSGPQWLSSHPNPGNRSEYINREAELLKASTNKVDQSNFNYVRARLRDPRAGYMSDTAPGGSGGARNPAGNLPAPTGRVEYPSARLRTYTESTLLRIDIPENWRDLPQGDNITFAPEGGYGQIQGNFVFTHGAQVGATRANSSDLRRASDEFIYALSQGNPNLKRYSGYQNETVDRRNGLSIVLSNVSEVTGQTELVTIYTTLLRNGDLLYVIGVAPEREYRTYQRTFQNVVRSIQVND